MHVTPADIERKIMSGEYATFMAAVCGITRMKGVSEEERTRLKELARKNISITMAPRRRRAPDGAPESAPAPTAALAVYEPPKPRRGSKDPYARRDALLEQLKEIEADIAVRDAEKAKKAFLLHMDSLVAKAKEEVQEDWDMVSKAPREQLFEIARELLASIEEDPSSPEVAARLIGVVCATLDGGTK